MIKNSDHCKNRWDNELCNDLECDECNNWEEEDYITKASKALNAHIMILIIGAALVALRPLYAKWIRSIKTSIDVEDSGNMAVIDISGDD